MSDRVDIFIDKAKKIHGNKYDYSYVEYKNNKTKVIIICPEHGEFTQRPDCHLFLKSGCPKCSNNNFKSTTEDFIKKAKNIHGELYDYTKSKYININTKIIIICKIHGEFQQVANNHINQKQGCPQCNGNITLTTAEFIKRANEIHGNKYDYSFTLYVRSTDKVKIKCNIHGIFEQTPTKHLNSKHGCPSCGGNIKKDTVQFIEDAKKIHGDKYDYSLVNYEGNKSKVIIICKSHSKPHQFQQTPNCHLTGNGCDKCGGHDITTEDFIDAAKKIHGDKYDYSLVDYKRHDSEVKIICDKHGLFLQKPTYHINTKLGCYKCAHSGFSKKQIEWLEYESEKDGIFIEHAMNVGEYKVGKYKVDGYCEDTKTAYQFHGDYWHGNPNIHDKDKINEICKKTMGHLYEETIKKDEYIKNKGYKLVIMWENDWNKLIKSSKK